MHVVEFLFAFFLINLSFTMGGGVEWGGRGSVSALRENHVSFLIA